MVMKTSSLSTAHRIKKEIDFLPRDQIFTTQELLHLGGRNAIDAELYRLVKAKAISRLARGVFIKADATRKAITTLKVAEAKAKAFGKTICLYGETAVHKLGLSKSLSNKTNRETFYTSGATSSFKFADKTIQFISASPKKRALPENRFGLVIKAAWHLGRRNLYKVKPRVRHIAFNLKRKEILEFKKHLKKSPLWLLKTFYPSLA